MQLTDDFGAKAVEGARQLLGVKFRHQGRNQAGVDCIGLVLWGWHYAGWHELDSSATLVTGYERVPTGPELAAALEAECDEVPLTLLRPGDIVSMIWEGYASGLPCHLAMVTQVEGGLRIIHTHWKTKVVSEHPADGEWQERICKGYRPKGII